MLGNFSTKNQQALLEQIDELQNKLHDVMLEKQQLEEQLSVRLEQSLAKQGVAVTETEKLRQQIEGLNNTKKKLEISLDVVTEHADLFEMQLVESQNNLEQKVIERTQELAAKNQQLQLEIQERLRIEAELMHAKESADTARIVAEMANRAKSSFLAKMSHELLTPLNAILGYSYLVQKDLIECSHIELAEEVKEIQLAGEHLLRLVSDILDVSKIETATLELKPSAFVIYDLITEVVNLIQPTLGEKQLMVRCNNKTGMMFADITRVRQILQHLLSNAVKFTQQGKITLAVRIKAESVFLQVRDTGIGIPRDKLLSIFEAFNQVDNSYTRRYEGSGIGLTLCKQLCQAMNGNIHVKSVLDKGSIFTVQLPRNTEMLAMNQRQ
ncbi:signal transduction histidine kinase [Beggiatoa alba B18LD]|uniref:histidine kinase n=1 Tax=Beggiatoa alba B18LD TaxID=395493 RepID=I3CL11_9GAMM|nr:ATP-binding protein [Beggiatoa alba]EIJ44304.1 signal transduction histidine kinase [Beggiatoa alba B18LD]